MKTDKTHVLTIEKLIIETRLMEKNIRDIYDILEANQPLKESEFGDALLPVMFHFAGLKRQMLHLEQSFKRSQKLAAI